MKITFTQTDDQQGVRWTADFPCGRTLTVTVTTVILDRPDLAGADWINHQGQTADKQFSSDVARILADEENELTLVTVYDPEKLLTFPTGPTWSSYHHAIHWSHAVAFARHCLDHASQSAKTTTPHDGML